MPRLQDFHAFKQRQQPIVMITCYSAPTAAQAEAAGIDIILVGDSLGTTLLGYENTSFVTMRDMEVHTAAVARGMSTESAPLILADMPCNSYDNVQQAVKNAHLLLQAGGHAVKLEGAQIDIIEALHGEGIAVCAHLGYLPQTALPPRISGKQSAGAQELLDQARAVEAAGAAMVVLELVPAEVAQAISERIRIPTIGIGAGVHCDGQVQVLDDILGMSERVFKHAKIYVAQRSAAIAGITQYGKDVRTGAFPTEENASHVAQDIPDSLR